MLEFIICDDNQKALLDLENMLDKIMMKNKIKYNIKKFNDYDEKFLSEINKSNSTKIYILDIETPTNNGIEIAMEIRKEDLNSYIIFLTGHDELGNLVLRSDLFFLAFINKFDNTEKRLTSAIEKVILNNEGKNILRIETRNITYQFKLMDILYVTRENSIRKTVIHAVNGEYEINKTLCDVMSLFDERFVQTHRCCYVNIERIKKITISENKIMFDNNEEIDLLSSNFKKGFEEKCREHLY